MDNAEAKQHFYSIAITRVSTIKQKVFGESPEEQVDLIELTRKRTSTQFQSEIAILKTFEFAESASVDLQSQPVQKALTYIREYKGDIAIRFAFIKCIDRFTRAGVAAYDSLQTEFAKLGVTLIDAYGVINPTTINTLEHLGLQYKWSVFRPTYINELLEAEKAKSEVRDIETRMLGAAIRYIRLGYWRGSTPLGFVAIQRETEHGKRFILNPHTEESKWFIGMFELKAEGVKQDQEIVDEINKMGFITRPKKYRDKEDHNKTITIKGQRPLDVKRLRNYIQNPIYAGVNTEKWLYYNGKLNSVYLREGGIVSVELFNKANHGKVVIVDEGGQPKVYKGQPPQWQQKKLKLNPKYPYKQYILCPFVLSDGSICRHNLKASSPKGKLRYVPTYHCALNHKYWGINAAKLEATIASFVKTIRFSEKFIYNFEQKFIKAWNLKLSQINRNVIDWEKRVLDLRDTQTILEDKLKFATTQTGFQVIEEEIEKTKAQIAKVTIERNRTETNEVDIQTIVNAAKYWMEHFHFLLLETQNPLHRAALFGKIFEELPTYEELANGTPKLSGLFALNEAFNQGQSVSCGSDGTRTRDLLLDRETR